MIPKKIKKIKKEYLKKKKSLKLETRRIIYKFIKKSKTFRAGKCLLAHNLMTRKKKKKASIGFQTTVCLQTGHYKSRINLGKLSRFSFKSTADKNNMSHLIKKSH